MHNSKIVTFLCAFFCAHFRDSAILWKSAILQRPTYSWMIDWVHIFWKFRILESKTSEILKFFWSVHFRHSEVQDLFSKHNNFPNWCCNWGRQQMASSENTTPKKTIPIAQWSFLGQDYYYGVVGSGVMSSLKALIPSDMSFPYDRFCCRTLLQQNCHVTDRRD